MGDIVGLGILEAGTTALLITVLSGIMIAAVLKLRVFNNQAGHPLLVLRQRLRRP
jgi:hypothetical protein